MTRINLVPPAELMDQHLFAEFREMTRISAQLWKAISLYGGDLTLKRIPKHFVLGTGHVTFFYDKGLYLEKRFEALRAELLARKFSINTAVCYDPTGVHTSFGGKLFYKDYTPTEEALKIIRQRLAEKIAMKPTWYCHSGVAA